MKRSRRSVEMSSWNSIQLDAALFADFFGTAPGQFVGGAPSTGE